MPFRLELGINFASKIPIGLFRGTHETYRFNFVR